MILACFGLAGVLGAPSTTAAQKAPPPPQGPPAASARGAPAAQAPARAQAASVAPEAAGRVALLPMGTTDDEKVQALFDQAVQAFDRGRMQEAWGLLSEAWTRNRKESFDIAGNMGIVALKLGRMTTAAEYLFTALQKFPVTHDAGVRRGLEEKFTLVRQHVARVMVRVDPPAAEVVVNGQRYSADRIERGDLFLPPGQVVIEAQAEGYVPERQVRAVGRGQGDHVVLALRKKPPLWPGLAVGAAGLGGMAAGAGLMLAGASEAADAQTLSRSIVGARESCVPGASNYDARCPTLDSTARRADNLHDVGLGLLVGGGAALAGAGGYLIWREVTRRGHTSTPTFVVTPSVDTGKAAIFLRGSL